MGSGFGMGASGGIFMIIFWIAIIAGVILLVRWLAMSERSESRSAQSESALEILKKRYAKSEISYEDFKEKKKHLE